VIQATVAKILADIATPPTREEVEASVRATIEKLYRRAERDPNSAYQRCGKISDFRPEALDGCSSVLEAALTLDDLRASVGPVTTAMRYAQQFRDASQLFRATFGGVSGTPVEREGSVKSFVEAEDVRWVLGTFFDNQARLKQSMSSPTSPQWDYGADPIAQSTFAQSLGRVMSTSAREALESMGKPTGHESTPERLRRAALTHLSNPDPNNLIYGSMISHFEDAFPAIDPDTQRRFSVLEEFARLDGACNHFRLLMKEPPLDSSLTPARFAELYPQAISKYLETGNREPLDNLRTASQALLATGRGGFADKTRRSALLAGIRGSSHLAQDQDPAKFDDWMTSVEKIYDEALKATRQDKGSAWAMTVYPKQRPWWEERELPSGPGE
jgi:hypothetical protein